LDAMKGIEDRPRVLLIRTEADECDCVRLTVVDSGSGFDSQAAERLFEAFYTTKSNGMGIGLSISRSIVERFGGRLWAMRNDGPGSTFSFSIPRFSTYIGKSMRYDASESNVAEVDLETARLSCA